MPYFLDLIDSKLNVNRAFSEQTFSSSASDICVAPESQGGFEREQIREQLGGFIGHFSMGRLRRFLSGIVYGNPFRAGTVR